MSPIPASSLSAMACTRRTVALRTGSRPSCSTATTSRCSADAAGEDAVAVIWRTMVVYRPVSADPGALLRDNLRMTETDAPRRDIEDEPSAEPAPPPQESRTPPHGDPL